MKYDVYYSLAKTPDGPKTLYDAKCSRAVMLEKRRYLIKSKVFPRIFLGDIEIEVTDDDK